MRPLRHLAAILVTLLATSLTACGGGSPAASKGDGGNGGQESTSQSAEQSTEPAATASVDAPPSQGGGGTLPTDPAEVVAALTPPNSTEGFRIEVDDGLSVGWETSDSMDSLIGYYDDVISRLGFTVFNVVSSAEVHSWIFGDPINPEGGGNLTIGQTFSGTGASVTLTFGVTGS